MVISKLSTSIIPNIRHVTMPLSKERLLLPSILKWVVEPLRDLNIYNIHLLVGLFGNPNRVEYLPNVERGVDTSGILVLDYCNFKSAAIGAITIFGVTNTLPEIGLTLNGQEEIVTNLNNPNHRMYDKFVAFEKMIATMDFESVVKQLKHSRQVMEVLDQASKVL